MNKQSVKRRDFLKTTGSFLLGVFLVPFEQFFRKEKIENKDATSTKEAMHYTTDDNLAG